MEAFDFVWTQFIIRPMLNTLIVLYVISFSNMGIAILLFTILVRLVTLPLTIRQVKQMRAMSGLQPRIREIQTRYARDRTRISKETMQAYKDAGVSPIGCLGPMIIQMPILFGLFRVLVQTLFTDPDKLVGLSEKLYTWIPTSRIYEVIPLNASFLWLDLAEPDPTNLVIPVLVFVSTWIQQKMTMTPATDAKQMGNQTMMLWMMPILIAVFSFSFPSGLALYWIISNFVGVGIQYFVTGWQPLFPLFPKAEPAAASPEASQASPDEPPEEIVDHGSTGHDRPNRRRSNRAGPERARRRPRRGRGRSTK